MQEVQPEAVGDQDWESSTPRELDWTGGGGQAGLGGEGSQPPDYLHQGRHQSSLPQVMGACYWLGWLGTLAVKRGFVINNFLTK